MRNRPAGRKPQSSSADRTQAQTVTRNATQMPFGSLNQEDRKIHLAMIAASVFWEKGYNTASLRDISIRANISKAGLYHYFRSKEEILTFIIVRNTEEGERVLRACIADNQREGVPPEEGLRRVIRTYATYVNKSKEIRLLVLRERHQLTGENKQKLYRMEQRVFHLLRDELNKVPFINQAYDRNLVAFMIIAMSHWMGYWLRDTGRLSLGAAIEESIDVLFKGMLAKEQWQTAGMGSEDGDTR